MHDVTASRKQDSPFAVEKYRANTICLHTPVRVWQACAALYTISRTPRKRHAPFATVHSVEDLHVGQGGEQLFPVRPARPSRSLSPALGGEGDNSWYDSEQFWSRGLAGIGEGQDRSDCYCVATPEMLQSTSVITVYLMGCRRLRLEGGSSPDFPNQPWRTKEDWYLTACTLSPVRNAGTHKCSSMLIAPSHPPSLPQISGLPHFPHSPARAASCSSARRTPGSSLAKLSARTW